MGGNVVERVITKLGRQIKVIMVDESQDTDQLQIELIASLIERGQSFIIAVGNHYQSVYHFRGCLNNGMEMLDQRFNSINAVVQPLGIDGKPLRQSQ